MKDTRLKEGSLDSSLLSCLRNSIGKRSLPIFPILLAVGSEVTKCSNCRKRTT